MPKIAPPRGAHLEQQLRTRRRSGAGRLGRLAGSKFFRNGVAAGRTCPRRVGNGLAAIRAGNQCHRSDKGWGGIQRAASTEPGQQKERLRGGIQGQPRSWLGPLNRQGRGRDKGPGNWNAEAWGVAAPLINASADQNQEPSRRLKRSRVSATLIAERSRLAAGSRSWAIVIWRAMNSTAGAA